MGRLLLALLLLCAPTRAECRAFTVDDLLSMESYGQVVAAPRVGLLLVERRRPYGRAPDFGYGGYFTDRVLGRILAVALDRPDAGLRPLFAQEEDVGYWMGSLSPSGTRMSVFRLKARVLSLGVADLRRGTVTWFDVRPDLLARDPAPAWLDEGHLLVAEGAGGVLPRILRTGSATGMRLGELYEDQARGGASWTSSSTSSVGTRRGGGLVSVAIEHGALRRVFDGPVVDFALSPDRNTVAVVTAEAPVVPPRTPIGVGFPSLRHRLALVSISGRTRSVVPDVAPGVLAWSRTGVLLVVRRHATDGDWRRSEYLAISSGGDTTRLGTAGDRAYAPEPADALRFQAAWSGSSVIALVRRDGATAGWRTMTKGRSEPLALPTEASPIVQDGRRIVFRRGEEHWDLVGRRLVRLPSGTTPIVATSLDPFSAGDRERAGPCGRIVLHGPSDESGQGDCGPDPRGLDGDVLAAASSLLVVRTVEEHGIETIVAVDGHGRRKLVDRINGALADVSLPNAVRLETIDDAGRRLSHWLLLPFGAPGPVPLVVQPYPGRVLGPALPIDARPWRHGFGTNALLLVGAGFGVLLPSMPRRPDVNPVADVLPQVGGAVAAAGRTGFVTTGAYGVMGHSFGAWAAMVLAGGSDCLSAVVAANGVYDLTAIHGSMVGPDRIDLERGLPFGSSAGWAEAGQGAMRDVPARAGARYASASPILRAASVSAPVLLVGGDLDPVDLTQTERMFMEIARSGGDATILRFWGEGHTVSSPANLRAYWKAAIARLANRPEIRSSAGRCGSADVRQPPVGGAVRSVHDQAPTQASQLATNMSDR